MVRRVGNCGPVCVSRQNLKHKLSLASYWSSGDWRVEQASAVGSPEEVTQIGRSACVHTAALRWRSTTEPRVNAPLIVVDSKFQLEVARLTEAKTWISRSIPTTPKTRMRICY
jgi:hypothetical protein